MPHSQLTNRSGSRSQSSGLQERLLHDLTHIAGIGAQPRRAGARQRLVPFGEQPERRRIASAGQPGQIAIRDVRNS